MVASGLEAGAAGVLAVHADAHLERGPQSPCPDSAHTGSVGRRRRNRRGARGGHNYNWLLLWLERHNFFLTNTMLFSLPLSLAAHAAGIADLLIVIALLVDNVLGRRWHFYKQQGLSREQQRYSKLPHTLSTSSRSILHTRSSFHIRHFHYRHPYTRLQHRLEHVSRTNLTYHMT